MLATWKYRPRNTFIQSLDPRTRLIFMLCVIFALTIPEIWDYRIVFPLFIVGLNGFVFGRGGPSSVLDPNSPVLFTVPFKIPGTDWGWSVPVTVSKAWFSISQILRMLSMAILAIPIPYTMDPNIYGTAFKRMGASDRVSFTMDLAFRFLPTFTRDLATT